MVDISKFAKNGYNDKPERKAFRVEMKKEKSILRDFIKDYCDKSGIDLDKGPYSVVDDPLGPYAVDMAIVDKDKNIVCLVEVDVFFEWIKE